MVKIEKEESEAFKMRPEQFIFLGTTVSLSSVFTFKAVIVINSTVASHKIHCFEIETDKRDPWLWWSGQRKVVVSVA